MPDRWRVLALRRQGICGVCGKALAPGDNAEWNQTRREVRCLSRHVVVHSDPIAVDLLPENENLEIIGRGKAGKSANDKYQELQAKEHAGIRNKFGRFKKLGEAVVFLSGDSQKTANWKTGSLGEELIGAELNRLAQKGNFKVLHDRRIPPTKGNIDHLVITSAGIFVLDAKNYTGEIDIQSSGFFSNKPPKLLINGRDQSGLIPKVQNQVAKVEAAISGLGIQMPVRGVLIFVVGPLRIFIMPKEISGVLLGTQRGLEKIILETGTHSHSEVETMWSFLAKSFPEA